MFNAISQDDNNDWDTLFPGDKLREEAVAKIAMHPASWIMYHLALHLNATEDGATDFLNVAFHDTHVRLALSFSSWDETEHTVSLDVGAVGDGLEHGDEELDELEEAATEWIDMSTLDIEEKAIQHAKERAGAMFAHDEAVDVSSMNTEQFFAKRAPTGQRRGISGLGKSSNITSTDARQAGLHASQRASAANGSGPTLSHTPQGMQAGQSSGPLPGTGGGGEPPANRSGAGAE